MKTDTEIKNALSAADIRVRYDEEAKRLIGNKIILAHILSHTIDEFRGMSAEAVMEYIEGEPLIGTVPLEPGRSNMRIPNTERIIGFNTENSEINEGLARFDIVFYVRMKDGISQIIVNIEIQKDNPAGYDLLNRAVFYVSRLISSQKERDFSGMDYDGIKRVFSIWICMGAKENSMEHVHLTNECLLGNCERSRIHDLVNIVLLGIADELPESGAEGYELHRLLGALLSENILVEDKLDIIGNEYNIPLEKDIGEEVRGMCNLSEGIMERGIQKGIKLGRQEGEKFGIQKGKEIGTEKAELSAIRSLMDKLKMSAQQAMDILDIETVKREAYIVLLGE